MAKKKPEPKRETVGRNTVSGRQLMEFIERIERIRETKKELAEGERLVFAELKAAGFDTPTTRTVLKRRAMRPGDLDEAQEMLDMYLHAIGMAREAPLFRAVGMMEVDLAARDQVIDAFLQLVPAEGEIIVRIGKQPVRLYRDKDGTAHAEDHHDEARPVSQPKQPPAAAARPRADVPDVDEDGAFDLGGKAFADNQPITSNPFPWDDKRRQRFDAGWRAASGTDGMGPGDE